MLCICGNWQLWVVTRPIDVMLESRASCFSFSWFLLCWIISYFVSFFFCYFILLPSIFTIRSFVLSHINCVSLCFSLFFVLIKTKPNKNIDFVAFTPWRKQNTKMMLKNREKGLSVEQTKYRPRKSIVKVLLFLRELMSWELTLSKLQRHTPVIAYQSQLCTKIPWKCWIFLFFVNWNLKQDKKQQQQLEKNYWCSWRCAHYKHPI